MDGSPHALDELRRDPRAVRQLQRVSRAAAAAACAIGALALLSWPLDLPWLRSGGHAIQVQPNAALGILLAGAALLFRPLDGPAGRWVAAGCAAVTALLGGLTALEHVTGLDLHVDRLLVDVAVAGPGTIAPGRMGPPAALNLLLGGLAILLLGARRERVADAVQALALGLAPAPLLGIVGYAYGVALLYGDTQVTAVALPGAIALLLVDLAILLARPDHGFVATLAGAGAGSTLARRMLAYAVALPILLGGLALALTGEGPKGAFAVSILVVGVTLVLVLLVLRDAMALDRMERARDRARQQHEASREELARALGREQEARALAEAASRAKDEFLSALSHELRTPLNAILGWNRLLRDSAGDPQRLARGAAVIERNGRGLAQLLSDLVDMSRLARGTIALERSEVELAPVVDAAIEAVRAPAEAKGVALSRTISPELPAVSGDAARLQQIAWNLLSNAVKFTGAGGRVDVSLGAHSDEVVLSVEDTGIGIAPEFLPHVFERFRQADGSPARRFGGLGLGLAVTQQLVALHGGAIEAASAGPGRGATFRVMLPALARAEGASRPAAGPARARPQLGGARILVVDDESDSRDLLLQLLASWGAHPAGAASVREALDAVARERPDLLVSDIAMPVEDGFVLVSRLRRAEQDLPDPPLPAIALTAFARTEDRARTLAAGFDAHVAKPIEPDALLATLLALLGRGPAASRGAEPALATPAPLGP